MNTKMVTEQRKVMCPKGEITIITLKNKNGSIVELSSLGAGINRIVVPDKDGNMTDVVLTYGNPADYLYDSPCAGKTPGRFANRISNAEFTIDGTTYHLTKNDGPNSLHGGPEGFHNQIWNYRIIDNGVEFYRLSPDGEEGYPGNLDVSVTYRWNEDNSLDICYEAESDAPTIINLTNHAYFNLNGFGDILDHTLTIESKHRIQSDSHDIPTGKILPVENTPFDFRNSTKIGLHINDDFENLRSGKGYNHYFIIDSEDGHAAMLFSDITGIRLYVDTDMPGLMLYTGNWLADSPAGFKDNDGVAIECQFPPDAPGHPGFPSTLLRPHERYHRTIRYRFSR